MHISSIKPINMALSGVTNLGQSGLGSDSNEAGLHIPQSSGITETSPSDCLVIYQGHLLESVLPLCREAVGVFYSPSRRGTRFVDDLPNFNIYIYIYTLTQTHTLYIHMRILNNQIYIMKIIPTWRRASLPRFHQTALQNRSAIQKSRLMKPR